MPLYEYCCPDCGEKFEKLIQFRDSEESVCPKCSAKSPKVPSTFEIRGFFRWYKPSDYGKASR